MSIRRSCALSALVFSAYTAGACAAQVHSAAGLLPGDYHSARAASSVTPPPYQSRAQGAHTPPPLPHSHATASTVPSQSAPGAVVNDAPHQSAPTAYAMSRAPALQPHATSSEDSTPKVQSFDDAMASDVNIDVVNMRYGDIIEKLTPEGWRMRFQHVDQGVLDKRVDMTANSTRGDVLYQLLAKSGLSVRPFEGFDKPLLLVTSSQ